MSDPIKLTDERFKELLKDSDAASFNFSETHGETFLTIRFKKGSSLFYERWNKDGPWRKKHGREISLRDILMEVAMECLNDDGQ